MFVTTLELNKTEALRELLQEQGFILSQPPYTIFTGKKKGVSCSLYQSGKLVVQGKESPSFIEFYLEPQILQSFVSGYQDLLVNKQPRIGIDEAGKGDVFGPLVIAGVYAGNEEIVQLKEIGVKDSKNLSDQRVLVLADKIKQNYSHQLVVLYPRKYNELYAKFRNLNSLLAWGHATVAENLIQKTGCSHVVIDQFAAEHVVLTALKRKKLEVELEQRHRAEDDYVVAAASILARAGFLQGLKALGERINSSLPKGASNLTIDIGKKLIYQYGPDILQDLCKTHFKTVQTILAGEEPLSFI